MSQQSLPGRDKSGYLSEATIAALATAPGGAVSIIRISGPLAFPAVNNLSGSQKIDYLEPRKLSRIRLQTSENDWLDDSMWVRFVGPDSFTGEDVVELHLHGSAFIATRVLKALAHFGIRQALPGEFSFRAVRNGKIALSQAQAIADLLGATNSGAAQLALEKLSGTQNLLLQNIADRLRKLATLSEIGIDFADQDVEEVSFRSLKKGVPPIQEELIHLRDSYDRGSRLQEGIKIAFVGLPNAGKSSFFNALLGEDRSIVSEIEGTTRDIIRERLTLQGSFGTISLRLEDTAGLRHSKDTVEKMGIERTSQAAKGADLILFVLDPSCQIDQALEQWNQLGSPAEQTIGILTKNDLHPAFSTLAPELQAFGIARWIKTSSATGEGLDQVIQAIESATLAWTHRESREVLLTRLDHLMAVEETLEHLTRAYTTTELDLFSADIRQALHALSPLIGETLPDDILGKIFSNFCIGK